MWQRPGKENTRKRKHAQHNRLYDITSLVRLLTESFSVFLSLSLSNGTSMISLIIPPKDQISRVAKMLADEFGTASNIKSRVNRLSVLGAITSVQQRLKLYNKGACLFYFMNTFIPSLNAEKA